MTKLRGVHEKEVKDVVLSTRVDDNLLEILEDYKTKYNIPMSRLIREALQYFARYAHDDEKATSPYIIFCKNAFAFLIEKMDEKDLAILAEICFQSTSNILAEILIRDKVLTTEEVSKMDLKKFLPVKKPRALIGLLKTHVYDYIGQNWLSHVSQYFHKDKFYMTGKHNLNKNFSIFFKLFLERIMFQYNFIVIQADLEEKQFYLIFQGK